MCQPSKKKQITHIKECNKENITGNIHRKINSISQKLSSLKWAKHPYKTDNTRN
jgi:hypothetical protein